jgi:membrane protease YdiL (CAAX protease family)
MNPYAAFINDAGRLRSGWRIGIFVFVYIACWFAFGFAVRVFAFTVHSIPFFSRPLVADLIFRLTLIASAVTAGSLCNRFLEGLPWRAFGLGFHERWWRDLLIGSLIGILSLVIAAAIAFAGGGLRFSFSGSSLLPLTLRTLIATAVLFVFAGLGEEALFRGYPLQTLTRAHLVWLAILVTSLLFGAAHLGNPNVVAGITFTNTVLAGVWLTVAYLRTRSLWFPLGVHWSWNWALGSVFGLPVSGLKLSSNPLMLAVDHGPAWLTGGDYGIEGGVACTFALAISTLFIWKTRLVSATPELLKMTANENPVMKNAGPPPVWEELGEGCS